MIGPCYLVPERKPRSGTILDFGSRILDSKKKAISVHLVFSSETGTPYFEVFVQTLSNGAKKLNLEQSEVSAAAGLKNDQFDQRRNFYVSAENSKSQFTNHKQITMTKIQNFTCLGH